MFCSVMIPSRGRAAHLVGAIDSCFRRAANPSQIEFLVRLDDDDPASLEELEKYLHGAGDDMRATVIVGPRGRGYADLHLMYNELAKAAGGEWLLQFNDDMRMETPSWDAILAATPIRGGRADDPFGPFRLVCLINPADASGVPTPIHPFVKTFGVRALGHFSLNAYCDAWIGQVHLEAGAAFDVDSIRIRHLRDQLNDEVVESQRQSTAWAEFQSEENCRLRAQDVEVLRGLLATASSRPCQSE